MSWQAACILVGVFASLAIILARNFERGMREMMKDLEHREEPQSRPPLTQSSSEVERQRVVEFLRNQIVNGGWSNVHRYDIVLERMAEAIEKGLHDVAK